MISERGKGRKRWGESTTPFAQKFCAMILTAPIFVKGNRSSRKMPMNAPTALEEGERGMRRSGEENVERGRNKRTQNKLAR